MKWTNVKDRLPDKDGRYLVVEKYHCNDWVGVNSFRQGKFDPMVDYWMTLPDAPKESK
jgi:hypothetical protein